MPRSLKSVRQFPLKLCFLPRHSVKATPQAASSRPLAECQQAFTVTTPMPGRKVMFLLSSKIAPGLLVAPH